MMEKWIIKGKELTFEEETHTYTYDGKVCMSVTQFLHWLFPKKYEGVDETMLKNASERGTYIHESIEFYEKYGIENKELQEFRNYLFLKEYYNFYVWKIEVPIVIEYKGLVLCGRLDQILIQDKNVLLNDIKTTYVLDYLYLSYQLGLYKIGVKQSYNININKLTAIHLRKDTRKFVEIDDIGEEIYKALDKFINEQGENNGNTN